MTQETTTTGVAEQLQQCLRAIKDRPELVTPQAQATIYGLFLESSEHTGLTNLAELAKEPPTAEWLGQMLMAAADDPDIKQGTDIPDLNYWRDVARHIGPDWAQSIYHIAVFMTKVA